MLKRIVFLLLMMSSPLINADPHWPFPWARACPVNWPDMEGHYQISENAKTAGESISIELQIQNSNRVLHVSRYSIKGTLTYDGITIIKDGQRSVRLYLNSIDMSEEPVLATIKLYYPSESSTACTMDALVPVLTLKKPSDRIHIGTQYQLIRVYK